MARIKMGALITDIRGKIQGTVFQNSQGGLIMRNNPTPVNKGSIAQNATRVIIGNLQNQWKGLGDTTRAQWSAFATFTGIKQVNDSNRILNGQQLFFKINAIRQLYSKSNISNPLFSRFSLNPVVVTVRNSFSILTIDTTRALVPANEFLELKISGPVGGTVNNPSGRLKQLIFTTTASAANVVTQDYIDIFGKIPNSGDEVFIEWTLRQLDNGLYSAIQSTKVTVG
jgi:hypothetical protein